MLLTILIVLALLASNKFSHDQKSQMDSAIRASHRLVKAVASRRELVKDERLAVDGLAVRKISGW